MSYQDGNILCLYNDGFKKDVQETAPQ